MEYAPEFYNLNDDRTKIYGYTGFPSLGTEITIFIKKKIHLNGKDRMLFGSIRKSEDPYRAGREIVMLGESYRTQRLSKSLDSPVIRYLDEHPIMPKIDNYKPLDALQQPETARILRELAEHWPKHLRRSDEFIHNDQSHRLKKGKGPRKDKLFKKRDPKKIAIEDGALKYLQICNSQEYQELHMVDALESLAGAGGLESEDVSGNLQRAEGTIIPRAAAIGPATTDISHFRFSLGGSPGTIASVTATGIDLSPPPSGAGQNSTRRGVRRRNRPGQTLLC